MNLRIPIQNDVIALLNLLKDALVKILGPDHNLHPKIARGIGLAQEIVTWMFNAQVAKMGRMQDRAEREEIETEEVRLMSSSTRKIIVMTSMQALSLGFYTAWSDSESDAEDENGEEEESEDADGQDGQHGEDGYVLDVAPSWEN